MRASRQALPPPRVMAASSRPEGRFMRVELEQNGGTATPVPAVEVASLGRNTNRPPTTSRTPTSRGSMCTLNMKQLQNSGFKLLKERQSCINLQFDQTRMGSHMLLDLYGKLNMQVTSLKCCHMQAAIVPPSEQGVGNEVVLATAMKW